MTEGYSICFNKWALDKDIKEELGLLLIISSLCAEKGYCWASNQYLAELFQTSEVTISRKIKKLESKNYIIIEYEKRGCEIINRQISINFTINKNDNPRLTKMITDDYQNCKPTINKNDKENNTINNNIKNNKENKIKEIVDYLNLKMKTKYKSTTKTTSSSINARLEEGYSVEDFKTVIDKKYDEWFGTEWEKYLTPDTLFRPSHFEKYLNQKINTRNKDGVVSHNYTKAQLNSVYDSLDDVEI